MAISNCVERTVCWRWLVVSAACFIALSAGGGARAADNGRDLTELDIEELVEIEVATVTAASRRAEKVTSAPSAVTVVTADEIRRFGWRTLADVLRSLRGFYVTNDRNYNYLGVRGFGRPGDYNSRVLLLVDGHQVNDNIFDTAYIGTEFILDVDLIDRIEVVRGPVSALYGGNAFFGVVDVRTKSGAQIGGAQGAAAAGSFDTYKARLTWGHAFEKGPDVVASGTWYQSAGPALRFEELDFPWTNHGRVTNDDDKAPSFFLKVKWFDVTFSAANVNREKGIPTASFASVFGDRRARTIDMRTFAEARFERAVGGLDVMARVFYDQYDYLGYYPFNYGTVAAPDIVVNKDDTDGRWWGVEARVSKRLFDRLRLAGGTEFKHHFLRAQRNFDPGEVYLDVSHSSTVWAAYAQTEFDAFKWLSAGLAARYDRYDTFGGALNPRFSLVFAPFDSAAFKYLYGRAFRPPNEYELHYRATTQKPAQGLEPETIGTHELVYEHFVMDNRLSWTASVFYSRIKDMIVFYTDPEDGLETYKNEGSITSFGAEAKIEYRTRAGLIAHASYAWQRTEDDGTGAGLSNSPAHMLKARLSVPLWRDRLFLSGEEEVLSERTTIEGGVADAHAITNLTALWRGLPQGLETSLSVYNVLNQVYGDPGSEEHVQDILYQDGRTFRLTVSYTY